MGRVVIIAFAAVLVIGLGLLIPGGILYAGNSGSNNNDPGCFNGLPLLIAGAILAVIGALGICSSATNGNFNGSGDIVISSSGVAQQNSPWTDVISDAGARASDRTQVRRNNAFLMQQQQWNQIQATNNLLNQQMMTQNVINSPC